MPAPAVIAAGIVGGASLLGSAYSAMSSAKQAEKQRDWQEDMSNTSHQREVEDLRKAGLNPILSAKLGGASTPLGAQAQVPDYSGVVKDAMSAYQAASQIRLQQAQARNLDADSVNKEVAGRVATRTETNQIDMVLETLYKLRGDADNSHMQNVKIEEEIKNIRQTLKLLKLEETHSALDIARARQESDFYKSFGGKVAPWLDHIMGKLKLPPVSVKNFRR